MKERKEGKAMPLGEKFRLRGLFRCICLVAKLFSRLDVKSPFFGGFTLYFISFSPFIALLMPSSDI